MTFNLAEFKKRRKTHYTIGVIVFWGGLILLCLDMTTSFPTPVRGAYAFWWLIIMGVGLYFYVLAKRLPLEETIGIAESQQYHGELRITDVVGELKVSVETAEKVLRALEKKGYARCEKRGSTQVWVFVESSVDRY